MRFIVLLSMVLAATGAFAGGKKYPVSDIPAPMLQGAHVVKRFEDTRMELVNTGNVILKKTYVLTVLDEEGADHGLLVEFYSKLREVRSIDGWLYDAAGNELRRLKNKEVQDRSAISDMSIYEDNRVKLHQFSGLSYPYTVAYEVEVQYNHSFIFPPWVPQNAEHVSVEESNLTVVCPEGYKLRYRNCNYKEGPVMSTESGKQVMKWQVRQLKPVVRPFAAPVWNELTTMVYLAPSQFSVEGYSGEMNTWSDLGRFIASLNRGRDELPPNVQQDVVRITAGLKTNREKVEALYRYFQQNTRYISIQLGIGSWQPFEASFVAQKGYGDCKALSNYMFSLLKAVGIRSHYAIIKAGKSKEERKIVEDFPMSQANHALLCVPVEGDTLWLECVSQTSPPGYLGSFTGNRKALLVDDSGGGALVSTPRYGLNENQQLRTISGKLDATSGNLEAKVVTHYAAEQQDDKQSMLEHTTKDELKKTLNTDLDLATYDILNYKYNQKQGYVPQIEEQLDLMVSRYATVSGKRIFINPNLLNRGGTPYTTEQERTCDFVFDVEYRDVDSAIIELPEGYTLEALPSPVYIKTAFGFFSSSVKLDGNKLLYHRVREQYAGRFKPAMSEEIAKFYAAVYKSDHGKVVLVKN